MSEISAALSFQAPVHAHIGVDEAGRGCLAGPVVAGAVLAPDGYDFAAFLPGLTDSKALSEKKRDALRLKIMDSGLYWAVGFSWPTEIDRVNILNATFRAMSRAVCAVLDKVQRKEPDLCARLLQEPEFGLYIDGSQTILQPQWLAGQVPGLHGQHRQPELAGQTGKPVQPVQSGQSVQFGQGGGAGALAGVTGGTAGEPLTPGAERWALPHQRAVVKGDLLVPSISAASIMAKTQRDLFMRSMERRFPGYGFAGHKGYGTKDHMAAIAGLGECTMHRKTFCKNCGGRVGQGGAPKADQFSLLG